MTALVSLPDWSKTVDPKYHADYSGLREQLAAFVRLSEPLRRSEVKAYSETYCFPKFVLRKASGLYLLFRLAFALPREYPRDQTKVFGGWLHPSATESEQPFLISWPVNIDEQRHRVSISSCRGYFGKGYDAIGEYDYFVQHFHLRTEAVIAQLEFPE